MKRFWGKLSERIPPKRWQLILTCLVLGLVVGGLVKLYQDKDQQAMNERDHLQAVVTQLQRQNAKQNATDVRLADAIHRLAALEHPTRQQLRDLRRRILRLTPAEARALVNRIDRARGEAGRSGATQGQTSGRGHDGAGTTNQGHHTPAQPPTPTTPTGPPTVNPPSAPTPPPVVGQPPTIDIPPIDLDGPNGPLPPVDLPPVTIPSIPIPER